MFGKTRRLNRLFVGKENLCLLSPLDHGGWLGPVKGLDNPEWIVGEVVAGGANAVLASPGFLQAAQKSLKPETGLVLRVSLTAGLSKQGTQETPIATLDFSHPYGCGCRCCFRFLWTRRRHRDLPMVGCVN